MSRALLLLAFFAKDEFVGILDALALIGLRLLVPTDFSRDLADLLTVGARHFGVGVFTSMPAGMS